MADGQARNAAMVRSALISAGISLLLWVVITLATGGSVAFALLGGVLCAAVVFAVGYLFRRLFLTR